MVLIRHDFYVLPSESHRKYLSISKTCTNKSLAYIEVIGQIRSKSKRTTHFLCRS